MKPELSEQERKIAAATFICFFLTVEREKLADLLVQMSFSLMVIYSVYSIYVYLVYWPIKGHMFNFTNCAVTNIHKGAKQFFFIINFTHRKIDEEIIHVLLEVYPQTFKQRHSITT